MSRPLHLLFVTTLTLLSLAPSSTFCNQRRGGNTAAKYNGRGRRTRRALVKNAARGTRSEGTKVRASPSRNAPAATTTTTRTTNDIYSSDDSDKNNDGKFQSKARSSSRIKKEIKSTKHRRRRKTDLSIESDGSSTSSTSTVDNTTSSSSISGKWNVMYEELQQYRQRHGHCLVPSNDKHNLELGRWVAYQRVLYKRRFQQQQQQQQQQQPQGTSLTTERINALNNLGFVWDLREYMWWKRYNELCHYKTKHGNCLVPKYHPENPALSVWVRNQRNQYSLFKKNMASNNNNNNNDDDDCDDTNQPQPKSQLTQERIDALHKIGFVFEPQKDQWYARYEELRAFRNVHGHCSVPEHYEENPQLGLWVVNQRTRYKNYVARKNKNKKEGGGGESSSSLSMTVQKIKALESLGFQWSYKQHVWDTMLQRLKAYMDEVNNTKDDNDNGRDNEDNNNNDNGRCINIPIQDKQNQDLRLWVIRQRREYHKLQNGLNSCMTPSRIRALEGIGFQWSARTPRGTYDKTSGSCGSRMEMDDDTEVVIGPTVEDWTRLFRKMKEKGIDAKARAKEHWFDGEKRFDDSIEKEWGDGAEEDLLDLWNQEDDEDFL